MRGISIWRIEWVTTNCSFREWFTALKTWNLLSDLFAYIYVFTSGSLSSRMLRCVFERPIDNFWQHRGAFVLKGQAVQKRKNPWTSQPLKILVTLFNEKFRNHKPKHSQYILMYQKHRILRNIFVRTSSLVFIYFVYYKMLLSVFQSM